MFTLLAFLIIGSTILIYSKLYFFFWAKIVYKDFVKKFFFFSSLLFLFFCIIFKKEILNYYSLNSVISLVIIYFLSFFSFCLTIGLKSISSPTEEIFKIINSKKVNINYLIKKIKNKRIIKIRIQDLIKQGLVKKNSLELDITGYKFAKNFALIKKIFNIKIEG